MSGSSGMGGYGGQQPQSPYGGMGSPYGYGGMGGGMSGGRTPYGGGMGPYGGGYPGGNRQMPGPPSPWGQAGRNMLTGSAPWMQQMNGPPSNDVMSGANRGIPQLAGAGDQWLPNYNSATPQYYNAALWAAHPSNPANQQAQQPFAPTAAQQGTWSPGATGGGAGDNLNAGAAQNWTSVPDLYTPTPSTNVPGSGQGGGQAAYQAYLDELARQQAAQQLVMPGDGRSYKT